MVMDNSLEAQRSYEVEGVVNLALFATSVARELWTRC